ncbi:MAG: hypothetical protein HQL37_15225 [Alphaproteobacteria bacterium]|nr:hypothetical protein [Alphaproteobacteria bacterium]
MPRQPQRADEEALDILRRLEPVLHEIQTEQKEQRRDIVGLREDIAEIRTEQKEQRRDIVGLREDIAEIRTEQKEQRRDIVGLREDIAEMKGRVSQMPTLWQLLVGVFGIMGSVFAFLRFGMPTHP